MVNLWAACEPLLPPGFNARLLAAAEASQPLLWRLDPQRRAKVLMALVALVLAGTLLVMVTYLGGRRLRRIARKRVGRTLQNEHDWYRKPLVPPAQTPRDAE